MPNRPTHACPRPVKPKPPPSAAALHRGPCSTGPRRRHAPSPSNAARCHHPPPSGASYCPPPRPAPDRPPPPPYSRLGHRCPCTTAVGASFDRLCLLRPPLPAPPPATGYRCPCLLRLSFFRPWATTIRASFGRGSPLPAPPLTTAQASSGRVRGKCATVYKFGW
jgi:hypothetical protein